MSAQTPLSAPHLSAWASGQRDGLGPLTRSTDAVLRSVAVIRNVMLARRSPRSMGQDLPWDVGLDRLAEQANPPWVPRGWWFSVSDSMSRLVPSWFPVRRDRLRDAPCLGAWDPTPKGGRFVFRRLRGRRRNADV